MDQQKPRKNNSKGIQTVARFSGVAIQMGLTIYFGNALGVWLDEKYDKVFWESSITLFAVFISMYLVIKQAINLSK